MRFGIAENVGGVRCEGAIKIVRVESVIKKLKLEKVFQVHSSKFSLLSVKLMKRKRLQTKRQVEFTKTLSVAEQC